MKRFAKLIVLFATIASFSVLANEGFAKGLVKAKPARTHKHRINEYPNNSNPNRDPNYPSGSGSPITPVGSPPVGSPVQPVKPTPRGVLPSGLFKAML